MVRSKRVRAAVALTDVAQRSLQVFDAGTVAVLPDDFTVEHMEPLVLYVSLDGMLVASSALVLVLSFYHPQSILVPVALLTVYACRA
jgi:hypothetical protein